MTITLNGITSVKKAAPLNDAHVVASGSNRLLLVILGSRHGPGANFTGISYGGVALTKLYEQGGNTAHQHVYYLLNPVVGSANITSAGTITAGIIMHAMTFYGVDQSNPFTTPALLSASTTNISVTYDGAIDAYPVACLAKSTTANPTSAAGQARLAHEIGPTEAHSNTVDTESAPAASNTSGFTFASAVASLGAFCLRPASLGQANVNFFH